MKRNKQTFKAVNKRQAIVVGLIFTILLTFSLILMQILYPNSNGDVVDNLMMFGIPFLFSGGISFLIISNLFISDNYEIELSEMYVSIKKNKKTIPIDIKTINKIEIIIPLNENNCSLIFCLKDYKSYLFSGIFFTEAREAKKMIFVLENSLIPYIEKKGFIKSTIQKKKGLKYSFSKN